MKKQINNSIKMTDGTFGISLHIWELVPTIADSMLIEVEDDDGRIIMSDVRLLHQLYLDTLKQISCDGKYNVYVTPQSSKFKRINIFEEDKK